MYVLWSAVAWLAVVSAQNRYAFLSEKHAPGQQCYVTQGQCTYRVAMAPVKGTDCMMGDNPALEKSNKHQRRDLYQDAQNLPVEKLEDLDKKLTSMMEGLSIRSLRHWRKIRSDLKHMASSIDLLKQEKQGLYRRGPVTKVTGGALASGRVCPPEFVSVGTWPSCYRFSEFNATWHEAREYCYAFGANMVALDTMKENYIIDYLIKSKGSYKVPKGWWTSGNYIVRNRKWMWTSKHHLKPMAYTRVKRSSGPPDFQFGWAPGEPNARSTMHCMMLYRNAMYRWHDARCTDKHNFICEIEL